MSHESLQELLARLRAHLSTPSPMDAETRRQLGGLSRDLERALGGKGSTDEAVPRLESLAVRFEAGHPALAETLREIIDALVKAGI
jgi:hypothetical protein